jgi:hypothetical protein
MPLFSSPQHPTQKITTGSYNTITPSLFNICTEMVVIAQRLIWAKKPIAGTCFSVRKFKPLWCLYSCVGFFSLQLWANSQTTEDILFCLESRFHSWFLLESKQEKQFLWPSLRWKSWSRGTKWIVIRGPLRGHSNTPCGRPTPSWPIDRLGLAAFRAYSKFLFIFE